MEINIKGKDIEIIISDKAIYSMTFDEMAQLEQAIEIIRNITDKLSFGQLHFKY